MPNIHRLLFVIFSLMTTFSFAQESMNFGFELKDKESAAPSNWYGPFSQGYPSGYVATLDSLVKVSGKYSLLMAADTIKSNHTFGACSYTIPATYEGTRIQLKGYLKTENISPEGFAGLWMRIDGSSGVLAFNNMQDRKITGTNEWKEYTIDLDLDEDAETIIVGGLVAGKTGKIWLDDFSVFIDDKELDKAPRKQPAAYKARKDTAFINGSGLNTVLLNDRSVNDLQLLGQVWGFLKYYHPAIAAGDYNWDFELFRILPDYLNANSPIVRDRVLLDWILKLGPVSPCTSCKDELAADLKMKPDLAWLERGELDVMLKQKFEEIRKNRNQRKNYYVSLHPHVGNPIFNNEDPYGQFVFPDAGFRLLTLFRYWNMVQYFFPYKYAIGEDWNNVLKEFIPKFLECKNKLEYRLVTLELIGRVHDTHANLWGQDSILSNYRGKYIPAVQAKFIEGKLVVTDYYSEDLGEQSGLKTGDIITSVNSVAVDDLVKERVKFYPASNYPTKLRDMAREILRGSSQKVELSIERNGEKILKSIERFPVETINTSIDWIYNQPEKCFKFITDDIGYIHLGSIRTNLLEDIFKTFTYTKGIVIDIRNYPSEFVVFTLSNYLLDKEKEFVKFSRGDVGYPGAFGWTPVLKVGEEPREYYKGKVVILINELTQSQAEYTTMAFRTAQNARVIGSTTAGADGNVSNIVLPGNLKTMISGIGVYYPDGRETQRVGIVPDIEVKPTIKGIRERKDEVLDKAVHLIQSGN